jgi:sigma-B regulation protein RsbQ
MEKRPSEIFNVNITGSGSQPLMFAHGFGCDQKMWRFTTPAFESNYRIVLFDYIGCGRSDLNYYDAQKYASLNGYAEDVVNICKELNLKEVVFVGHSVSSMIGLLAAISNPELFSAVIMIGPSPYYMNNGNYKGGFEKYEIEDLLNAMDENYIKWANFLAPNIMGNPDKPELREELTESFCSVDPDIAKQFARVTFYSDNRQDLEKLLLPTLLMQCSEDILAPFEVGEFCNKNIKNSSLQIMRATGHCPHLSSPEETITGMKKFLSYL